MTRKVHYQLLMLCWVLTVFAIIASCSPKKNVYQAPKPKVEKKDPLVTKSTTDDKKDVEPKGPHRDTMKTIQDIITMPESGPQQSLHAAVLLPLKAKDYYPGEQALSAQTEKFLNFYQGLLLGFKTLQNNGLDIYLEAYDTKRSTTRTREILDELEANEVQVVIGGYAADNIKALASWAKDQKVIVVSPWRSSSKVTKENPFFLQINPTLDSYLQAIVTHLKERFSHEDIILVGKKDDRVMKRIDRIQELQRRLYGDQSEPYRVFVPDKNLEELEPEELLPLISGRAKVFVMPFTSNLTYVSSFISKLTAANPDRSDRVIGMPNWATDKNLSYGELIAHRVRLPVLLYVDQENPEVKQFRKRFLDTYGMVPLHDDAYRGYDLALFVGRAFQKYGTNMLFESEGDRQALSCCAIELQAHRSADATSEQFDGIHFYKNSAIRFREYSTSGFWPVD